MISERLKEAIERALEAGCRGSSYRGRRRGFMGRYSRTDAREHMRAKLEDMLHDADNEKTRDAIRRCIEQIDRA